ncbi:MAG: hypothetical protein ACHQ2E_04040 [Gemmatimonadales bacterium]
MAEPADGDEFYIGYLPVAPSRQGRMARRIALGLVALAAVLAVVLVTAQRPFVVATFEYGSPRRFEGWIVESPYPVLLVPRPGTTGSFGPVSTYLLTTEGKHGARDAVRGLDGQAVSLEGTLAYRDDQALIEIARGSVPPRAAVLPPRPPERWDTIGTRTVEGEIIDSKCGLGVMNPAAGKPHRTCAARCISGGIPPMVAVRDSTGRTSYLFLTDHDGRPVADAILSYTAEPVRITGMVTRRGDALYLAADTAGIRRITH